MPVFLEPVPLTDELPARPPERREPPQVARTRSEPAGEPATDQPSEIAAAPLLTLRDGDPAVIDTPATLAEAASRLASGAGPVAVDAERASSYRYGHRAYLVQLRREGSGTLLVDPIACPDLSPLGTALGDTEWVIHAATQDLPCLAEVGLNPPTLFDTELAGRLAGYPRVGLATMVETLLGWRLEKDHSAADWSRRPLPQPWLRYAALDVEMLVELRDALEAELRRQGKLEWALEEFEHERIAPSLSAVASVDRWRRVSGIHRVRDRRQLAVVRALWQARDRLAREADISPTRLLPDAAIVHAASSRPASAEALAESKDFVGRGSRRHLHEWWSSMAEARALPDAELPEIARPQEGPPPAHRWQDKDRAAAARLMAAKAAVAAIADEHALPAENLLQPDAVRRLAWQPPDPLQEPAVADRLAELGARRWQVALTAGPLARALARASIHQNADTK